MLWCYLELINVVIYYKKGCTKDNGESNGVFFKVLNEIFLNEIYKKSFNKIDRILFPADFGSRGSGVLTLVIVVYSLSNNSIS